MSRVLTALVATLVLGALLSCQTAAKKTALGTEDSSDLSLEQAQARKARLSEIHYALAINLDAIQNTFSGFSTIDFTLTDTNSPLRLDFFQGQVTALKLNDQPLDLSAKKPYWIELPTSSLKAGHNVLTVQYSHEYSNQGQGLHRFEDPETKEIFLYSQFETFDANRFMPCFDQPDLRATLNLEVTAPRTWEVVSTTRETETKIVAPDRQDWKFATTPKIATYLFSLHAGPFKVWKDDFKGMPLRLLARPSLARFVDAKKWFQLTKQGLQFYNNYFDYAYPFKKYDQLLVPEFNAGAMENVGAVTFSERYISRGAMGRESWRRLSDTLLHEMAHMWFGDLVTMRWWNDLWLNESFATYMSALAMNDATEFKESWQNFYAGDKNWAYWTDSLSTTHPIEAPVKTVKEAFTNFDGITYGKGAAVLKQMSNFIGPAHFQAGVRNYLKAHAFDNAQLSDFIAALQGQTTKDLRVWSDRWFKQSGTDVMTATWSCEGDRLKNIAFEVTPVPNTRFRAQKFSASLHGLKGDTLTTIATVVVDLDATTKTVTGNWACPVMIYPNADDAGYFAVRFDPQSLQAVKDHLSGLSSPLLRTMVWSDLWRMVRQGEMPLKDYVSVVEKHFALENDPILVKEIANTLNGRRSEANTVLYYWPVERPEARAAREKFIGWLEANYRARLDKAAPGSDAQQLWFDSYLRLVQTKEGLNDLAARLDKAEIGPKFPWDPDRRWSSVHRLERFGQPQADVFLTRMAQQDPSERGKKESLAADAVRPVLDVKQKWVTVIKDPDLKMPLGEANSVLGSLFPPEQAPLAKSFKNDFYDYLKKNGDNENMLLSEAVIEGLAPLYCEKGSTQELRNVMKETRMSPSIRKNLMIDIEEDERCQTIRGQSGL